MCIRDSDRTEEFGSLIADGAAEVMNNVTSATYSDGIITIVPKAGAVPSLKAPSVLYEKGIRGIEQPFKLRCFMQKSFSLQYKNIAMYIFCWLMPYNICLLYKSRCV